MMNGPILMFASCVLLLACASPNARTAAPNGSAASCPEGVLSSVTAQDGGCFEPARLGPDVAEACSTELAAKGWVRDAAAEQAIGAQTGKTLVCHHGPA